MGLKKISIIIPTLSKGHQKDLLLKLEQLLKKHLPLQAYSNYEALVYCDGPNPEVVSMVQRLNDERIKVYATGTTLGFWGHPQTRFGIEKATGDYMVRMNDDNRPYPEYLETLVKGFGAIGGGDCLCKGIVL